MNSALMACIPVQERPEAILPTMGGQTALNLAKALAEVSPSPCNYSRSLLCPSDTPVIICRASDTLSEVG